MMLIQNKLILVSGKGTTERTLNQVRSPTLFWALSCAEFHWPEFYTLFGNMNSQVDCRNNLSYPLFVVWFFTEGVELFVKYWLYNIDAQ